MSEPRVLVVRLGALGDVLLALPALRRLRAGLPAARIDWLVEAPHAPVLENNPDLDRVFVVRTASWRRRLHRPSTWREMAGAVRALRGERFDVALDLQGLLKSAVAGRLSGARVLVGLPAGRTRERLAGLLVTRRAREPGGGHVVDLSLAAADEALRVLGGTPPPADAPGDGAPVERLVRLTEAEQARAEKTVSRLGLEPLVVLNPGAAWETKRWPPARFGELAAALAERGNAVFVAHGPGEEGLAAEVVERAGHARVLTFPTGIRELAALLARARLFIGGDTGPYHLARAVGTPAIGLFGPTDPERNGPHAASRGRGSGLPGRADAVVWGRVPCSPCYGRTCPTRIECMGSIETGSVLAAALERLDPAGDGAGSGR